MQFIKINTIEEFNDIENRIHKNRKQTINGYSANTWALPIIGVDGTILCPIEKNDFNILSSEENPIEVDFKNENYFPKSKRLV